MNLRKPTLLSAILLGICSPPALAQSPIFYGGDTTLPALPFEFVFKADANYRQNSQQVNFTGGEQLIFTRDGLVAYDAPCITTMYLPPGSALYTNYFGAIILAPPCALGTTGFLSGGDVDGDGLNDPAAYLAVTQVTPAQVIDAAFPEKIQLVAAPPSLAPRPSGGFTSTSALLFFNIQTTRILQYKMAQYSFKRLFLASERGQFDDTFVQGTYRYNFPSVNNPNVPVPITVNYFQAVDGFREVYNQKRGFKFNGFTFSPDGFGLLDPSVPNIIRWQGNTPDLVAVNSDTTQFRILNFVVPNSGNPLSDANELAQPVFPPFAGPGITQVTLANPLETSYTLPPGLIATGTTGLLQVTLQRNRGGVIADKSRTIFSIPVRFAPPGSPALAAADFIASKLPAGASLADKDFNNDYDGDGISNFSEWVFGSNPGDASSVPPAPQLAFQATQAGSLSSKADSLSGNWVFKVEKIENPTPALHYKIQRSTDMNTWVTVTNQDPNWTLVETATEIKVISATSELNGGNFFRAVAGTAP